MNLIICRKHRVIGTDNRNPDALRAAREEHDASLPKVQPVLPVEAKRIPILYYPLMAIVLLLLLSY